MVAKSLQQLWPGRRRPLRSEDSPGAGLGAPPGWRAGCGGQGRREALRCVCPGTRVGGGRHPRPEAQSWAGGRPEAVSRATGLGSDHGATMHAQTKHLRVMLCFLPGPLLPLGRYLPLRWPWGQSRAPVTPCARLWNVSSVIPFSFSYFCYIYFVFERQREAEHQRGRGTERGRHSI